MDHAYNSYIDHPRCHGEAMGYKKTPLALHVRWYSNAEFSVAMFVTHTHTRDADDDIMCRSGHLRALGEDGKLEFGGSY